MTCEYESPVIKDLGTLTELTLAVGLNGSEDGGSKMIPFHHEPAPSAPAGP